MLRKSTKLRILIATLAVVVLAAGAGIAYAVTRGNMTQQDTDTSATPSVVPTQNRPIIYTTEDSFTRYFQGVQNGTSLVDKDKVHQVPSVDWNEKVIVVVPFDVLSSQTYQSVSLETIDAKKTIVVDVLDSPKNCMVTQDNKSHLAFLAVDQSDSKAIFPISVRINPNSLGCEN